MASDPKAAPLADDLKELAVSLPTSAFPKAFFCALCSELAIDSFKLLCCNKAICATCQTKLSFPTTCPSCDHSPLEADSCAPNKALRNTMRVWLQKQKKKEEAKAAAQAATPALETTPAATEAPSEAEGADKPVDSVEEATATDNAPIDSATAATDGDGDARTVSASVQPVEGSTAPDNDDPERRGSLVSQTATQNAEPSAANAASDEQNNANGPAGMMGNNLMMNGMQGQMGFAFQGQGNFGGMGFNGMPNMMSNANWNNMNSMDYNINGMYNNFGGNMGLGMNDMSAMNMMNYGGGYGNGWNGMGGGYGNFNGFNQMGGYNQSGAYPEMMNQFPKNNFQNQNQNRFPVNQGGAAQHNNRTGSQGGSISGPGGQHNANSRPGSRSGPAQNVRRSHISLPRHTSSAPQVSKQVTDDDVLLQHEGESPEVPAGPAGDSNPEGEQDGPVKSTEEGNGNDSPVQDAAPATDAASTEDAGDAPTTGNLATDTARSNGLNQIQTVDTEDGGMQGYNPVTMGNGMQPNMGFANGMMNQFPNQMQMSASFDPSMNMGFHQNNNFGPRGGFNAAYGAATVLTGEPQGRGVEGAPTGPRAMREGRPNTGFSSRMNNVRYQPPPKSVTPAQSTGGRSPPRKPRSRSPQRDESLRTKDKSVSRSRSRSRARDDETNDRRERSRSANLESKQEGRGRSATPQGEDDYERRKDRRHRSSRYDDREEDYNDRHHDDRGSRGDRTRSASADSKYRSSRRDKDKHRSSRSHRDRSKEHRRRHRSRSPAEESKHDNDGYGNGDRESESGLRRKHRSDKERHRDRSRDRSRDKERERDRRDRKDREKDYDYEREKDRSRDKDKERRRRRDREAEEEERDYEDDKHRSSRRSHKDRDREDRGRDDRDDRGRDDREDRGRDDREDRGRDDREDRGRDDREDRGRDEREKKTKRVTEDDVVGKMMQKRAVSPPFNAPTGPSANTFSIKGAGRSRSNVMPPPQPPTGPRNFQPPKGPAADRDKDKHRRNSSASSVPSTAATAAEPTSQDHYAAEREKNARERNSRERVDRDQRDTLSKSLHSRMHSSSSSSRPSVSSKRSRDDSQDVEEAARGPGKSEVKAPTGPASHRDKRRKSGAGGDNSIANLFTAGLRKNAGKSRRGGVRTEGDVEREMERVERERDRR